MEFVEFPKIARLNRDIVVTEKIDGTNAQVVIAMPTYDVPADYVLAKHPETHLVMLAGSRSRYITPESDNFGFAAWVKENSDDLWSLGEGRHYGEWWGSGIQRGYGLFHEKRFSLFNVARWAHDRDREKFPVDRPRCCRTVPVMYRGAFRQSTIEDCIEQLRLNGSWAAPGFLKPEGVVVLHSANSTLYKVTLEKDEQPKSRSTT